MSLPVHGSHRYQCVNECVNSLSCFRQKVSGKCVMKSELMVVLIPIRSVMYLLHIHTDSDLV